MIVRRRDLLATGLVIALVAVYLGYLGKDGLPLIEDSQAMTSVAMILGGAILLVLVAADRYDAVGWFTLGLAVVGVTLGGIALVLAGSEAAEILLAAFIGSVLVIWGIELAENVTVPPPKL
jgi:FtsH-binding integral membrane protein